MGNQLGQINAFCSRRYNSLHNTHFGLAKAYTVIIDHVHAMRLNNHDPERDMLHWLSKSHTDPDLVRACKDVLEQLGSAHQPTVRPP